MQSGRTHFSRPSISGPFPAELSPSAVSSAKAPAATSNRSRTGVMSATLPLARSWLSRSSSSSGSSLPYAPAKPTRISEPKLDAGFRSGTLGAGATVVRTPQDALAGTSAAIEVPPNVQDMGASSDAGFRRYKRLSPGRDDTPCSPPLPPIPDLENDEQVGLFEEPEETYSDTRSVGPTTPSRPLRSVPPTPQHSETEHIPLSRPSLKHVTPPTSAYFPPVPSLPSNLAPSPPQMPFDPILISPPPTAGLEPSRVIVSLETNTATYRTSLETLTSRPSLLGTYLKSLMTSRNHDTDELSVYSDLSDENRAFHSIFHRHLTSSGLLSQTSTSMHVFLDRPSAPYAHILTYLRTPPSTPEQPAILPRPVQLSSSSSARLEALLELRDEARYLDLDELYKLCMDEIRLRCSNALGLHVHSRGPSSVSITSSRSLGTLREAVEDDLNDRQGHALVMRRHSSRKQQSSEPRARSKDSGFGTASPGSYKAVPEDDSPSGPCASPLLPAPMSIPGLQQRAAMTVRERGRSETRRCDTGQSSEWI